MAPILELLSSLPRITVEKGAILIEEGKRCGKLFVLVEGYLEVLKRDTVVAKAKSPGAVFGEISILLDCAPIGTVKARTPSTLIVIDDPKSYLGAHPDFTLHVASLMAARFDALSTYLVDIKQQYAGQQGVGMVDAVLDTLLHHQPKISLRTMALPV